MAQQRITYLISIFLLFWFASASAGVTKESVDQKIENLKHTKKSVLTDSIEVIVYDLYSFESIYGLSKIKELDQLISDDNVNAKLRIKHSLAAFDQKNKYVLLDSALLFANNNNIDEFKIEYYTSKGNWYYVDKVYDSSLVAILNARKLSSQLGVNRDIQTSHLLGDLFFSIELYEQAEAYFKRADSLLVDMRYDEVWRKRVIKNNLGLIEMKKGNFETALKVFEESKSLVPEVLPSYRDSLTICYYNRKIAECFYGLRRNYSQAIANLLFTYKFAKKHQLDEHLYPSYNILIKLYIKTDQSALVQQYFKEYQEYYHSIDPFIDYQKEDALLRAEVAEYLGDEKRALQYYKVYKNLNDSQTLQVKSASIVNLLTNQDYSNLRNNYNEIRQQRMVLLIGIFIACIFIAIIAIFAYRTFKLNKSLSESNQTKDKLFSIIAHDLRAPFNSIVGFSDLSYNAILEKDYDEVKEYNQHVLEKSKELLHLIDNLLNWSRTQQDRLTLQPSDIKLSSIFEEIKPSIELQSDQKSIQVEYQFEEDCLVHVDEFTMKTVFTNILSNAVKFSYPDSVIQVISKTVKNLVELSIVDQGTGITKEKLSSLFHLDKQQSTRGTSSEPGTGLGLLICKEFVERNQGTIHIESEEGTGTTVRVLLPMK